MCTTWLFPNPVISIALICKTCLRSELHLQNRPRTHTLFLSGSGDSFVNRLLTELHLLLQAGSDFLPFHWHPIPLPPVKEFPPKPKGTIETFCRVRDPEPEPSEPHQLQEQGNSKKEQEKKKKKKNTKQTNKKPMQAAFSWKQGQKKKKEKKTSFSSWLI